jgi:general secretion pathway protein D
MHFRLHWETHMVVLRMLMSTVLVALPFTATAADPVSPEATASAPGKYPELTEIIEGFSKRTGTKFNLDPRVRAIPGLIGIDPARITYEQLLATLAIHQYVTYVQDGVVIVVPDASARQLPTRVHTDTNFKADDNEWVTLLLAPKKTCAAQLVPILRPLMPQAAHLAADPQSGSLVAVDRVANLRRIADLVDKLDKAASGKGTCGDSGKSGS